MRFVSLFSGIEAASVAWEPLGWEPLAFCEIEPFPSAVLAERWPGVPNVGDVMTHDWSQWRGRADLVVGGPPCQAFSIAGLRNSLDDARGNLSLEYVKVCRSIDPLWTVTENVPGWLSTKDNAFGCFLGAMVGADTALVPARGQRWTDAGVVTGPDRTAAWRILDAQFFGVPQRRRRVFVVSVRGPRNWKCAAALLPLSSCMRGDHPPRREARERVASSLAARTRGGGGLGTDFECDGGLVAATLTQGVDSKGKGGHPLAAGAHAPSVAYGLHAFNSTAMAGDGDAEAAILTDTARCLDGSGGFAPQQGGTVVTHALRADGFDASEDGTGRWTPLVPESSPAIKARDYKGQSSDGDGDGAVLVPVAFHNRQDPDSGPVTHPIGAKDNGLGLGMAVRRLTPGECEKLQGFSPGYTAITYRGKPAADGPRYRALGNSMAVPCMNWIGRRIALAESLGAMSEMKPESEHCVKHEAK